jgi:hypothetical protein
MVNARRGPEDLAGQAVFIAMILYLAIVLQTTHTCKSPKRHMPLDVGYGMKLKRTLTIGLNIPRVGESRIT